MEAQKGHITQALLAATPGDEDAANKLWGLVHGALREMAHRELLGEQRSQTLSSTGLVHEAYFKLVDSSGVEWHNRSHFFAIACRAMRQILVDHARARNTLKRQGRRRQVEIEEAMVMADTKSEDLIALDEALTHLTAFDKRVAVVVEHRFFGGLSAQETAEVMGISKRTADREWRRAKVYLFEALRMNE